MASVTELGAIIERLDEMAREIDGRADKLRVVYLVLEINDALAEVGVALRGDETRPGVTVRAMAAVTEVEAISTLLKLWLIIRDNRPEEEAGNPIGELAGKVYALTAHYRSHIGVPGSPSH